MIDLIHSIFELLIFASFFYIVLVALLLVRKWSD